MLCSSALAKLGRARCNSLMIIFGEWLCWKSKYRATLGLPVLSIFLKPLRIHHYKNRHSWYSASICSSCAWVSKAIQECKCLWAEGCWNTGRGEHWINGCFSIIELRARTCPHWMLSIRQKNVVTISQGSGKLNIWQCNQLFVYSRTVYNNFDKEWTI